MTSYERFKRMYEHREADRVPIIDSPWQGTIRRWHSEGMPSDVEWQDFFDVDKPAGIGLDISPRYEEKIIEENDRWYIATSSYGVTMKHFKEEDSTPEFLDYKVHDPDTWQDAKRRMQDLTDRIPWDYLKANYSRWRAEGRWVEANFWFGFDVTHSWMVGTENLLIALLEEPDWCMDMFNTYLESDLKLFGQIYDAGYRFDSVYWPDDMGYKGTTFFSPELYRELVKPFHKRAADWIHDHGAYVHLHSCGNVNALLPDILDAGIDCLNPLEVKAGMNPAELKEKYGDRLVLHGGVNAVLWDNKEAILDEIERVVPVLKQNGGYIFSSDHSIPNSVSLENFRAIVEKVKQVGAY